MSKLEQLIRDLCPNGVEYNNFGEIATIVRGASPRPIKNFITDSQDGVSWIKIGDINARDKYVKETKERITQEGAKKSRFVKKGDFILSNSMSFGRPFILNINGCIHDGWLSISNFEKYFITDFLYHLLSSHKLQEEMKQKASFGGAVQNLNVDIVKSLMLPLPPLPVQEEIVRILDSFSELTTELTTELTSEFTARKKQYEYYRDSLLTFGDDVEWKSFSEFGEMIRGNGLQKKDFTKEGTGCIHYGQIYTYYGTFAKKTKTFVSKELANTLKKVNKGDLIIAVTSENYEDVCKCVAWLGDDEIVTGGHSAIFKHNQNPKYLAYYFQTTTFFKEKRKIANGTKVIEVAPFKLANVKIPLPPITVQERIVEILDRFDKLCNDISQVLPAEIKARQQQYEYYRDKLLTFKEKEVSQDE